MAAGTSDVASLRTAGGHRGPHVWDIATGRLVTFAKRGPGTPSFTADGRRLITVDQNGVSIWDIATGTEVRRPVQVQMPGCLRHFHPMAGS